MKIYLNEITDQGTDLDFTQEQPWVLKAVQALDEVESSKDEDRERRPRPVHVHFNLRKVDEVVVISGSFDTQVDLLCSRCGTDFHQECRAGFSGLYCTDPEMAGVGHLKQSGKPAGQNKGYARHAHEETEVDEEVSMDSETLGKDLDITYLPEDTIELADVLTEQIQFQIPLQPLCKESCKGVCANCGTDLNEKQCACSKLAKRNGAFAALENLKF